jgi:hypothetical protein
LSPLTKTFVVLLVLFSTLLSAAVIVFVQQVNVSQVAVTRANSDVQNARRQYIAEIDQDAADLTAQKDILAASQSREAALKASLDSSMKDLDSANIELAKLRSDRAIQLAAVDRLAQGEKAIADANGKMQDTIADLRSTNDKLVKQAADDARSIADQTNLYEAANRELEYTKEQLQQTQEKTNRQAAALQRHGITEDEITNGAAPSGPVPLINGVVRDKRVIGGVTYVTISVGSVQHVEKGMTFYIVDNTHGQFLGQVTIETVNTYESYGRLDGPADKLALVQPGAQALTKFTND